MRLAQQVELPHFQRWQVEEGRGGNSHLIHLWRGEGRAALDMPEERLLQEGKFLGVQVVVVMQE
jgi:hypothetical protein